jgi:hypothetical protein
MKKKYYVHKYKDPQGDHEVHIEGCSKMPLPENRMYLGEFSNCQDAVREAKKYYSPVDGCYYCCSPCHTS